MEERYFRYQYENTQDGIIQSGCVWGGEYGKKTTYLYMAGEYTPGPKTRRKRGGEFGVIPGERTLDMFVLGAYTIPYILRLIEILKEGKINTVILPYVAPTIRVDIIAHLAKRGRCPEELQNFLGAPYGYLTEKGVENIYLVYGNGPAIQEDIRDLKEGHHFDKVDEMIQGMINELEGIYIPVYYAGYIVENEWLYYFGFYNVDSEWSKIGLILETITMFSGPIQIENDRMDCLFSAKVYTREQRCSVEIKERHENCALRCLYRNDYDTIKKHMDTKHENLKLGLLNLGNIDLNMDLKQVIARYGTVLNQVRGISIPNCGNEKFWDKKLLSVFTGTDMEYFICSTGKNTSKSVIYDVVTSSSFNRFINVNEEFAYCFSGYMRPKSET